MQVLEPVTPLRSWMDANGFTYKELAAATHLSERTLKGYGRGERPIPQKHLTCIAAVLGCSIEYLSAFYVSSHDEDMVQSREYYRLLLLLGKETMGEIRREFMRRREFLRFVTVGGTALLMQLQPDFNLDTAERVAKAIVTTSRIDNEVVVALESITQQCWVLYRTAMVKADLLPSMVGHLQTLQRLLRNAKTSDQEQRLAQMISHSAQIAGEVLFDIQDIVRANEYYELAIDAASFAGDTTLQGIALGRQGFLPIFQRQFADALEPLEEAAKLAKQRATPTARAWIAMMQAEALANMSLVQGSRADDCVRSIEDAEHLMLLAVPGEDSLGTGFSKATLMSYEGICYLRLRKADDAQRSLQAALQEFVQPTRRRAIILTDLALAYILSGEVEEACRIASQALDLAELTQSARAIQRLRKLQFSLKPWRSLLDVRQLNERILQLQIA